MNIEQSPRSALGAAREELRRCQRVGSRAGDDAAGARAQGGIGVRVRAHGARVTERPRGARPHITRSAARLGGRLGAHRPRRPHPAACTPVLASARPRGRPWSALRAWRGDRELTPGQWRHGGQDAGLGEGWDKKRDHHGGRARARADEVCTKVTWAFCRRLPRRAWEQGAGSELGGAP